MTPPEEGSPFRMSKIPMLITLTNCKLTCAQQKGLARLELNYEKACANELIKFIDQTIKILDSLDNKG
jgi:hypothetical protein